MLNESNIPLEEDGIEEEILVEEECSVAQAVWGDIQGNIENQTDLQNALDAKQDSLTEAQLNAVNSGITSEKVTTYDGYADQIASKADQSALNAESTARGEADTALGTRIDNEVLARQQADNGLQSQIDAITSKSDVVDVVANYAALQAYDTSSLGNNDVIKVLDDETHEDALTYYRWSTTTQTWTYIGQEAPYYSKGQMDTMLQAKQDKLIAGTNIQIAQDGKTISATDTTYTAGNGLNLNGTEFSADTTVLATKTDLDDYYTKTETDTKLAPKLEAEVVAELPTTGAEGKLYLTPKAHTTSTATGNPIEATITAQAGQLESFQLDGDTFQQSYTGKNLFNKNDTGILDDVRVSTSNGKTYGAVGNHVSYFIKVEPSTTYALTTGRTAYYAWYSAPSEDSYISGSGWGDEYYFASPANAQYIRFDFADGNIVQFVKGTLVGDYEPYVGGQPSPSPEYPQQIQTVTGEQTVSIIGKNLLNITSPMREVTRGGLHITIADDGKITIDGTATGATWPDFIWGIQSNTVSHNSCKYYFPKALEAVTYSIKIVNGTVTDSPLVSAVFNDGSGKGASIRLDQPQVITATDVNGINRVYLNAVQSGTTFNNFQFYLQIESGTTATEVVPYSKLDFEIDLGSIELCKIGTYQDYIYKSGDDWKVHKAVEKLQLVSSQGWAKSSTMTTLDRYFIRDYFPSGTIPSDLSAVVVQSNYFTAISQSASDGGAYGICQLNGGGMMINTVLGAFSSNDAFKNWLDSNSVNAYYALTTATDTTITDTDLIAQLEAIRTASLQNGTNTITNTATGTNLAGDMEIGYYGFNPRNRYDKWLWLDINNEYEQIGS